MLCLFADYEGSGARLKTKQPKFWFVWSGNTNRLPSHRHATLQGAVDEAKRLATLRPGQPFVVLSAKCLVRVPSLDRGVAVAWFQRTDTQVAESAITKQHHPSDDSAADVSLDDIPQHGVLEA